MRKVVIFDPIDPKDKRHPFGRSQLRDLFSATHFVNAASHRTTFFWCCIIGLYHGLRASEIAGLSPNDIISKDGQDFIDLKLPKEIAEGNKVGRSKTIPRLIPLHPILIRLGFVQFASASVGREYLFDDLRTDDDGYRGDDVSDEMTDLLVKIGMGGMKLSFHSFRHSFRDACDFADIPELIIAYLAGWKVKGVMHRQYGSKEMKPSIIPTVAKITYGDVDQHIVSIADVG